MSSEERLIHLNEQPLNEERKSSSKVDVMEERKKRILRHMGKPVKVTLKDKGELEGTVVGFSKDKSLYIMYPTVLTESELLKGIKEAIEKDENTFLEIKRKHWEIIEVLNPGNHNALEKNPDGETKKEEDEELLLGINKSENNNENNENNEKDAEKRKEEFLTTEIDKNNEDNEPEEDKEDKEYVMNLN